MEWPTPKYSKNKVTKAGVILSTHNLLATSDSKNWWWASDVLSNWRACHGYPINTFQSTLRDKLKKIDQDALVAQRLKRLPSIVNKLRRYPSMNLARMQDIGGLRAVVTTVGQLNELHCNYKNSRFSHSLISEHNYIESPKYSGYRGIHLVYQYRLKKTPLYDGLRLELQLRTKLQHAWATTVETVGTFIQHSLKSSEGPDEWLKFFSLAGSAFSHLENSPPVPGYEELSKRDTFIATLLEVERLGIYTKLLSFSSILNAIPAEKSRSAAYYLVQLNLTAEQENVSITPFSLDQLEEANIAYIEAERRASAEDLTQVVLVAAGSVESLRLAYPNYFLDTHTFLWHLDRIREAYESMA